MNKQTEALRMAIEIMQRYLKETPLGNQPHMIAHKAEEAIKACKDALAQPTTEQSSLVQEPVAWVEANEQGRGIIRQNPLYEWKFIPAIIKHKPIPLYTHPAKSWQGLSKDEVDDVFNLGHHTFKEFARAIEAKLKEKNT